MLKLDQFSPGRRNFLTSIIPVCAIAYLGSGCDFVFAQTDDKKSNQTEHKFNRKVGIDISNLDYFRLQFGEFIRFAKVLEKEWGKEQFIAFLEKNTKQQAFEQGQKHAKELGDNSLAAYKKQFSSPYYQIVQTNEIVEDTDTVFRINVTECIFAKVFIDAGAGDIGFARACCGDYSGIKGFNSKIKLVRDKTLMQGHDCCNFQYITIG